MAACLHRERQPPRACACGTWLSSGNPLDKCARCNGGTWDIGEVPASLFAKMAAVQPTVKARRVAGEAFAELMEAR